MRLQADVAGSPQYPRELMRWSAEFYAPVLDAVVQPADAGAFRLHEHDYCLGDRKFGGNAQTISRDRWVHHTSFLWAFAAENMALLRLPDKRPDYRLDRAHGEFLTQLGAHAAPHARAPGALHDAVLARLQLAFDVREADPEEAWDVARRCGERKSNAYVEY